MLKHAAGGLVRRIAPRSVAALEEVAVLRGQIGDLRAEIADLRRELDGIRSECAQLRAVDAAVGAEVGGLHGRADQLDADLAESRRLSLRVAQLSDLVFDRLADRPGGAPGAVAPG